MKSDFAWVLFGRFITALIAISSLRIMTTFLSPSDYGQWVLLVAFQTFCGLFLINPVDQYIYRNAHTWRDTGSFFYYIKIFNYYIKYVSFFIFFIVFIWSINNSSSADYFSSLSPALVVGFIVYFGTKNVMNITFLNVFGFRKKSIFLSITSSLSSLIFSVVFFYWYKNAESWLFGQVLGSLLSVLITEKNLKHNWNYEKHTKEINSPDFIDKKTFFSFCLPLAAATGFMWLQNTGYRFLIGRLWSVGDLGILALGFGISAQLSTIVESIAMQFLYPYLARRISDAKSEVATTQALSDLMNVLFPIYAIWAGFNAICATALLELLTNERYHTAIDFVIFGAMLEFLRCVTNLWSNTARAMQKTKGLIIPYALGATVVLFGLFLTIKFNFDLREFSFALVFSGLVTCISMIFLMRKLSIITIDIPRSMFGLCIMLICFSIAMIEPIKFIGFEKNVVFFIISLFATFIFGYAVIKNNKSLSRLITINLIK